MHNRIPKTPGQMPRFVWYGLPMLLAVSLVGVTIWVQAALDKSYLLLPLRNNTPVPYAYAINPADPLVVSTTGGSISYRLTDEPITAIRGEEATQAAGKLAYRWEDMLFVRNLDDGTEHRIRQSGIMPAWQPDGQALNFVMRRADGDTVYRVTFQDDTPSQPVALLHVPILGAPPITDPATGRILIVETLKTGTTLYTIDSRCAGQAACTVSRRNLANVAGTINWADYHPSATQIVFSTLETGGLFLLHTATGEIEALLAVGGYRRRPVFSPDGRSLAFLTANGEVYMMGLPDMGLFRHYGFTASAVDWLD